MDRHTSYHNTPGYHGINRGERPTNEWGGGGAFLADVWVSNANWIGSSVWTSLSIRTENGGRAKSGEIVVVFDSLHFDTNN